MPFPASDRVVYGKNPLEEVVCQLRFPPILRIEAEAPVAFQEAVRSMFPMYQRNASHGTLVPAMPLPPELLEALGAGAGTLHEFATKDGVWKLSLKQDFLALTTSAYTTWSDFADRLRTPLAALSACYSPAFFVRIGLRYRDRIDRAGFGLPPETPWHELLKPEAVGELGDAAIRPYVKHVLRELRVELTEGAGAVRVVHGLQQEDDQTQTYIIDADFYTDAQTNLEKVNDVLAAFNVRAGRLFRWYVTPRLHDAMEPNAPTTR
jgi:uncharacterized protein (TIGR04255 family)